MQKYHRTFIEYIKLRIYKYAEVPQHLQWRHKTVDLQTCGSTTAHSMMTWNCESTNMPRLPQFLMPSTGTRKMKLDIREHAFQTKGRIEEIKEDKLSALSLVVGTWSANQLVPMSAITIKRAKRKEQGTHTISNWWHIPKWSWGSLHHEHAASYTW